MQDPRLRLLSVILLSTATFLSLPGAILSFLWLLLYPAYLKDAVRSPGFWFLVIMTGIISIVISLSETGGIS